MTTGTVDAVVTPTSHPGRSRRLPASLVVASAWAGLVLLLAALAALLPIAGYDEPVAAGPSAPFQAWPEFLGTDRVGRSVLSRVIYGGQLSLTIAVIATCIGMGIGCLLGLANAYFRGPVSTFIDLFSDAVLAFPGLVLLLAVASVIQPSLLSLSVLLGLLSVPASQRITAANARTHLARDYVLAARALGAPAWRLLLREVLPNIAHSLFAFAFLLVAFFMVIAGALDFLGVGVPPPRPSWGGMIAAGVDNLRTQPYLVFVPSIVLLLTVFAFNTIGDRLRERADGRSGQL